MPWIAAGATIGGAIIGGIGQSSANKANLQIARENRAWQEKMSNTAYQRAAVDLDKAGLNRILALGSPASTPGGNVATMGNVGAAGAEAGLAAASAQKISREQKLTLDQLKATRDKTRNEVDVAKANEAFLKAKRQEAMNNAMNLNLANELKLNEWEKSNMVIDAYRRNPKWIESEIALQGGTARQIAGGLEWFRNEFERWRNKK